MNADAKTDSLAMILAMALAAVALVLSLTGCASDRAAYVSQKCGDGSTNLCIILIMPEGGATLLPVGDSAIKAAVDAYLTGSGISTAGSVLNGAGKAIGTVEAIKAAKP